MSDRPLLQALIIWIIQVWFSPREDEQQVEQETVTVEQQNMYTCI